MKAYLDIVKKVLENGIEKEDRTGTGTKSLSGVMFQHDMSEGFPAVTTKKLYFKTMLVELEGFIKGVTDKKWYQERGCKIWNQWCNPQKVPYGHDEETKKRMFEERDLGPIYGFQWRHWNAHYRGLEFDYSGKGIDQLENLVKRIKSYPYCRRMIVSSWNPEQLNQMALPPCHLYYQVTVSNGRLNLDWVQRSVDTMIGLPFNIASYATLLHLLAKETGYEEGILTGHLVDTHIYKPHEKLAEEQIKREPFDLPKIVTKNFTSIFDWTHKDTEIINYKHHPPIKFEIAI